MSSDFHLDRLPIVIETFYGRGCGCGGSYGGNCGCGGSCGCGCRSTNSPAPIVRRGYRELEESEYAGDYGVRLLGVGWPDWWYDKTAYATCPEYTELVDKWIKLRNRGVELFGSIGWFAPKGAKIMVEKLKALEEKGDSIRRRCKSKAESGPSPEEIAAANLALTEGESDNTLLYVGLGAATLVGLGMVVVAAARKKKKKQAEQAGSGK